MSVAFHSELYSEQAVRGAVEAFAQLATLSVERDGVDWVVRIEDAHPAYGDRVADELANYVLKLDR